MMTRRRSARLASSSCKTPNAAAAAAAPSLSSLAERDESPVGRPARSLAAAVASSPMPSIPKTPGQSSILKPPVSEMHPSLYHTSMAAAPSSAMRLGFSDVQPVSEKEADGGVAIPATLQSTPSKVVAPSSDFTFRYVRREPRAPASAASTASTAATTTDLQLGPEAQRMMDELRGETARIKAELAAQRELEKREDEQVSSRRFAKAKGKAGRYSAVHMSEFKKMDSIENHPSAFRAHYNTPRLNAGVKRTQSKASLREPESAQRPKQRTTTITTPATATAASSATGHRTATATTTAAAARAGAARPHDERDPPSPAKRARQHIDDDATTNRPVSRDGSSLLPRPKSAGHGAGIPRSKSNLASLMTPTKSSLARVASSKTPAHGLVKSHSKSSLGTLKHSATTGDLAGAARSSATETATAHRFDRLKSILMGVKGSSGNTGNTGNMGSTGNMGNTGSTTKSGLPLPSVPPFSKTPVPALRIDKELPAIPHTMPAKKLGKNVDFTPQTKRAAFGQNSPSPFKSAIPRSTSKPNLRGEVSYPSLEPLKPKEAEDVDMSESTVEDGPAVSSGAGDVAYPDLSQRRPLPMPPVSNKTATAAQPASLESRFQALARSKASLEPAGHTSFRGHEQPTTATAASGFSFRSNHTIHFGSPTPSFGSSPGQARLRTVRPSILPSEHMPGSFPASIASGTVSPELSRKNSTDMVVKNSIFGRRNGGGGNSSGSGNSDKENDAPRASTSSSAAPSTHKPTTFLPAFPHGMANKKRHRASWDDEEADGGREEDQRAAKKQRKEPAPEGDALLAPRLMAAPRSPSKKDRATFAAGSVTPSPTKRKPILSLSRLNMLARPKLRK